MKVRLFTVFVLVIGLALILVWSAAAQGPAPSGHRPPAYQPGQGAYVDGKPASRSTLAGDMARQGVSAAMALGSPGTAYRYVHTFGRTEVPYTSTTTHLNRPYSLAVDKANNVYVGDVESEEVLKFNSSGVFQARVGYTGRCWAWDWPDSGICRPNGLGVGPDGNLWVAEDSQRVSVFTYTADSFTYISQLGVTWENGDDNDHFDQPEGVAFDSAGRIYVADRENSRVQIFDSDGTYNATLGTGACGTGDDEFCRPHGLAIGSGDVLYVADSDNHRVQVFSPVGDSMVFSQSITTAGTTDFGWVSAVAVDANHLYVADDDNDQVHVLGRDGVYSSTIAGECNGPNDWFCWPMDIAVDANGNVYVPNTWEDFRLMKCSGGPDWTCDTFAGTQDVPYVTDNYHYFDPHGLAVGGSNAIFLTEAFGRRLIKLNSSGTPQWVVGEPGVWSWDNDRFGYPEQVALDSNGRVYVADSDHHRVQIFDGDGNYYATLGNEDCNPGNGLTAKEFCSPRGIAAGSNGRIYVADTDNHRVQVFDSNQNYLATLGTSGESGDDATHFNWPRGVAVDASNNVYVADSNNNRIQKCTVVGSSGTCSTFAGVTGEWGDNLDRLGNPQDIAVSGGKVFVAECGPDRVQVFDTSGAYLTTIGNSWGGRTGELRCPRGVDVDSAGNVYVTDTDNSRIQKFAPGVPGWAQVNINGFGDTYNKGWSEASVYSGSLYIAASNGTNGCEIWRTGNGTSWTQVNSDGFGDPNNAIIYRLVDFGNYLYLGTKNEATGGEVWRCLASSGCDAPSDWSQVGGDGLGDPDNIDVEAEVGLGGYLYLDTSNWTSGVQVYRSNNGTSWEQVNTDGFGDAGNGGGTEMAIFGGYLYLATWNQSTGGELWRCSASSGCDAPSDWSQIGSDGFGDADNWGLFPVAEFKGSLYISTQNETDGVRVYRSDNGTIWTQVNSNGFGNDTNISVARATVFNDELYMATGNPTNGLEIWKTSNGTTWEQVPPDGFGDSNNTSASLAVLDNSLYIATENWANGAEVWSMGGGQKVYLPTVLKNR